MMTIGIDVSKDKLDVLWLKEVARRKVKTRVFKNQESAYQQLVAWALKNTQADLSEVQFVMEATGIYHEPLAYALFELGANVYVVNPAKVKSHAQGLGVHSKTDKKDSFVIAHYGATMQPALWRPEPVEIRELKALIARLQAVEKDLQRERNRQEKARFSHVSEPVQASIAAMIDVLTRQKAALQTEIDRHIDSYPPLKKDRGLLQTIPGIGAVLSTLMLAVLRSRGFEHASQCSAFLGLNPVQHESGTSVKKRPHLSKRGDGKTRAKLYFGAVTATQHNPDIKAQYERLLKNGKCKMSALGAAMRKLVQICFGVLKHQSEYRPQVA